jgi:pectate lyase
MKKVMIFSLLLVTFALISGVEAKAQAPKRIQFAKGKASATVKGTTGTYGATYVVRAKSGQKLVLNLTPSQKVGIKVETAGRFGQTVLLREERGGIYEVGLEESGDYTIFIGSIDNKPVSFALTVKITNMTDI